MNEKIDMWLFSLICVLSVIILFCNRQSNDFYNVGSCEVNKMNFDLLSVRQDNIGRRRINNSEKS